MKSTLLKMLAGVSLLLVTGLGAATAGASSLTTITGGNTTAMASGTLDTWTNFVIVDTNNPISDSGLLTSWSYYAQYSSSNVAGAVQLVIVKPGATFLGGATVVYVSAPSTPFISGSTATSDGVVTVPIPGGVWVQQGDEIGLHFIGAAVVPFAGSGGLNSSGNVFFTNLNSYEVSTSPIAGAPLSFVDGATARTYAISVSGVTGAGCKDGAYATLGFSNQGACVSAFATNGDVPIGAPGH